jgi:ArsR family transcriptional regulator, arsenate/arsenite/antimonite-responsive transcriptional repressor
MLNIVPFAHALADETRCRILHLVMSEALCVCELAEVLRLPQSTLSSQLAVIQRAELLTAEKRGKWMFYRVRTEMRPLLRSLFKRFESTAEVAPQLLKDLKSAAACLSQRSAACCPPST